MLASPARHPPPGFKLTPEQRAQKSQLVDLQPAEPVVVVDNLFEVGATAKRLG
jgi:hypothetical protein